MKHYDLVIIGAGASAHAFLLGLPSVPRRDILVVAPFQMTGVEGESTIRWPPNASPKLKDPKLRRSANAWQAHIHERFNTHSDFTYLGFSENGGTRFWGCSIGVFDANDIATLGFDVAQVDSAYADLSKIIPISGNVRDDLSDHFRSIAPSTSRFRSPSISRMDGIHCGGRLVVGSSRNALKNDLCTGCSMCSSGCSENALWSADVPAVCAARGDCTIMNGWASAIKQIGAGYRISVNESESVLATSIVLAVDPVSCFALLTTMDDAYHHAELHHSPAFAWGAIGYKRQSPSELFGFAHSQVQWIDQTRVESFGHIFSGYTLSLSEAPKLDANPVVEAAFKTALPNMVLGNMYFRSDNHPVRLERSGTEITVLPDAFSIPQKTTALLRDIKTLCRENGLLFLTSKFSHPGTDLHYAGGVPKHLLATHPNHTSLKNIFVVGGASFRFLPAQSPTFTFMATSYSFAKSLN